MEINGKNSLESLRSEVQRVDQGHPQAQRVQKFNQQDQSPGTDRIELSVRSREVQHIDDLIRATPDVRQSKIDQVRGAIESGTYNVKAEKVADKIITGNLIDEIF